MRIAAWVRDKANQKAIEEMGGVSQALKPIKHRNKELVPYIELFEPAKTNLPIKKIVIGPHEKKETLAARLREKLSSSGIEVVVSDIPYANLYSTS